MDIGSFQSSQVSLQVVTGWEPLKVDQYQKDHWTSWKNYSLSRKQYYSVICASKSQLCLQEVQLGNLYSVLFLKILPPVLEFTSSNEEKKTRRRGFTCCELWLCLHFLRQPVAVPTSMGSISVTQGSKSSPFHLQEEERKELEVLNPVKAFKRHTTAGFKYLKDYQYGRVSSSCTQRKVADSECKWWKSRSCPKSGRTCQPELPKDGRGCPVK